jgi:hypothetical protein
MSSNRRSATFPAASSLVRAAALWGILWTFGCHRSSSDGDVTEPLLVDPPALSFQRTDGDTDRRRCNCETSVALRSALSASRPRAVARLWMSCRSGRFPCAAK